MNTNGTIRLSIPDIPVGPNGRFGLMRMHWTKRRKYAEKWEWQVRKAMGYPGILEAPPDKARVTITQHRKRVMDTDNLYASCKVLLDALVNWQLLYDDSPGHCELSVKQQATKDDPHTDITIEASHE